MRTGFRRRCRPRRRESRSSSSSGGPTSSSRDACHGSRGVSCAGRGSFSAPRRRWRSEARALGARHVRVVPSGVALPGARFADPDDPPHVLFVGGSPRRRASTSCWTATSDVPRVIVGDGPLREQVPEAVGFVSPNELGALLRAGGRRRLPLPPRGLRRRRARGDGARATRRRDRTSAASPMPSRTASPVSSSLRAIPPPSAPRSSGCWPTRASGGGLASPHETPHASAFSWEAATEATVAAYRDALA